MTFNGFKILYNANQLITLCSMNVSIRLKQAQWKLLVNCSSYIHKRYRSNRTRICAAWQHIFLYFDKYR